MLQNLDSSSDDVDPENSENDQNMQMNDDENGIMSIDVDNFSNDTHTSDEMFKVLNFNAEWIQDLIPVRVK